MADCARLTLSLHSRDHRVSRTSMHCFTAFMNPASHESEVGHSGPRIENRRPRIETVNFVPNLPTGPPRHVVAPRILRGLVGVQSLHLQPSLWREIVNFV